jgi:hypothetical protein
MPVYKFRTFEEAERALWNFNPDSNYYDRVKQLWDFANKLAPARPFKKGLFKFRSIKEANRL